MENHIVDLLKKSLLYFDNQNSIYYQYLTNTRMHANEQKILDKNTDEVILSDFDMEILGVFNHHSNVFLWSWSLPYLGINETKTTKELLNYGLQLEPTSNSVSHFFLKTLLVNARNYIDSDFDLELIQALSSYILKDKCNFIYPINLYNNENKLIITTYFIIKISSN